MSDFNSLANKDQVLDTPSRSDGIPEHIEDTLRLYGCQSIQQAGILLGLPQVAMATAQVLFHRFWYVSSMRNFGVRDMSMGSLLLASKLEEVQVHIRDLVNVFDFMSQWRLHNEKDRPPAKRPAEMSDFRYAPMGSYSEKYYDIKDAVLAAEMQLLKRLGFNVYVSLPHALMINYLQVLGLADSELQPKGGQGKFNASQCAWNYLNDAEYCWYEPLQLPLDPPWWELFDVSREELRAVASHLQRMYSTRGSPGPTPLATKHGMRDWLSRK